MKLVNLILILSIIGSANCLRKIDDCHGDSIGSECESCCRSYGYTEGLINEELVGFKQFENKCYCDKFDAKIFFGSAENDDDYDEDDIVQW